MKALFKITGFLPYILIVFLNTMTDLGHKITLQNTIFKAYDGSELIILTAVVNALILLPFIFLFSPSGFIADKYPKPKIIKISSFIAIIITSLILISYYFEMFWFSFGLTFLLAAQSAIYSPAKYGLIKEMVGNEKITQANALVQAITITAILLGAIFFTIGFEYFLNDSTLNKNEILKYMMPIGGVLILFSTIEFILSLKLKETTKEDKNKTFNIKDYSKGSYLKENIRIIKSKEEVWLSIVGLSLFWGISQLMIAVFGPYLKNTMDITNTIIPQALLAISGIGVILGSLFSGKISKNYIEIGTIPLGAFGIATALYLIPTLENLYLIGFTIFMYGFFSGLFIVPLNSIIQFDTKREYLGKVLAGNNFVQNISMISFLILTSVFAYFNMSSDMLITLAATIAFGGGIYTIFKMPQSLVRYFIKSIIGLKFKIDVYGLDNIEQGKGILLLGNHISFLDWAILQIAYPKQISFVIDKTYYNKWYIKPFVKFFKAIPISSRGSKGALKLVTEELNKGNTVALFPEGMISRNGHLSKFQKGFEIAVKETENTIIIPFYLRGLWEGDFSRASKKMKNRNEKNLSVSFGKAMSKRSNATEVKQAVFNLSIKSWEHYAETLPSIQKAWIYRAKEVGGRLSVADSTGTELSGTKFIAGTLMIANSLKNKLNNEQNIGLLLPTSAGGSIGNMAVLSLGKTIVNINYSSGEGSISHALKIANINKIITSKIFLKKLKAKGFDLTSVLENSDLIFLEDIKEEISTIKKVSYLFMAKFFSAKILSSLFIKNVNTNNTAAILFSSGSEGTPKGIELSHKNIMGNIKQTLTVMNPEDNDVLLGTLPIFHSFGLTITTLLPLVEGLSVACHPDPTDGFSIGKLTVKYEATILLGTSTFFRLYIRNRKLQPLMFKTIRLVVAGAEKLPKEIASEFKNKFGIDIFEGYGATETTPVATININDAIDTTTWQIQKGNKPGTVGLPVPGSNIKIVDSITFEELSTSEEGMVLIGGTQIMKGYIGNPEKTTEVIKEIDGIRWYVTGDKGRIDEDGFLTLVDRYSRFAKIGGEMVSLGLVESEIRKLLNPDDNIMATSIPDTKKGEKVILLIEGNLNIEGLKTKIKESGLNPLFQPAEYYNVEEIPKLGTGKADFKGSKTLAKELSK